MSNRKNTLASSLAGLKETRSAPPAKGKPSTATTTSAANTTKTSGTKGKSADNRFIGTTVYLHKQTHAKAKAALVTDNADAVTADEKRDLSDLIEQLLITWLAERSV